MLLPPRKKVLLLGLLFSILLPIGAYCLKVDNWKFANLMFQVVFAATAAPV